MPAGARGMQVAGATNAVPPLPRLWRSSMRSFHAESLKKARVLWGQMYQRPAVRRACRAIGVFPKKMRKISTKRLDFQPGLLYAY